MYEGEAAIVSFLQDTVEGLTSLEEAFQEAYVGTLMLGKGRLSQQEVPLSFALVHRWVFEAMLKGVPCEEIVKLRTLFQLEVEAVFELARERQKLKDCDVVKDLIAQLLKIEKRARWLLSPGFHASYPTIPSHLSHFLSWRASGPDTPLLQDRMNQLVLFCLELLALHKGWRNSHGKVWTSDHCLDIHAEIAKGVLAYVERMKRGG